MANMISHNYKQQVYDRLLANQFKKPKRKPQGRTVRTLLIIAILLFVITWLHGLARIFI